MAHELEIAIGVCLGQGEIWLEVATGQYAAAKLVEENNNSNL